MPKKTISAPSPSEDSSKPTYEELQARVRALESRRAIEFRVSEKGGVSVYGLGRFPVTLYYEQWTALLDEVPRLRDFLSANKAKLKMKVAKGE